MGVITKCPTPVLVLLVCGAGLCVLCVFVLFYYDYPERANREQLEQSGLSLCGHMCKLLRSERLHPKIVRRIHRWDQSLYDEEGIDTEPVVIVGAANNWPALYKWAQPNYLLKFVSNMGVEGPAVMVASTKFLRGTDGLSPDMAVLKQPELVFGSGKALSGEHRFAGGSGTLAPKYVSRSTRSALWASNGEVDSGLHWDENRGGFLTQVVGTKEVLMFPNDDAPLLYMRKERQHHFESSLFLSRDLSDFRVKYPLLEQTTPYVTCLQPGDSLYIPHKWMHEVVSSGRSVAFSSWVADSVYI